MEDVLVDYRVLAREHGTRLDKLEAAIGQFNEHTVNPLLGRFDQLESKIEDAERSVQASTTTNSQVSRGMDSLEVMGGWQGLIDRFKAEINEVVTASRNESEARLQSEIAQRFESLTQVVVQQQEENDKRNHARQAYMLNSLLRPLAAINDMCKASAGRSQTPPARSYGFQVSITSS